MKITSKLTSIPSWTGKEFLNSLGEEVFCIQPPAESVPELVENINMCGQNFDIATFKDEGKQVTTPQ